jgi:hypothetical protein
MAGRFKANGRTYIDTPAGHLMAARDKVADTARDRGHDMMHWAKRDARSAAPYFSARCGKCGAGVKVVAGRPPANQHGYPSLLRFHQVRWCPGKPGGR